jgi:hypothetical protein
MYFTKQKTIKKNMNTNHAQEIVNAKPNIADHCVQSCRKLLAGIEQAKKKIANEFQETLDSHAQIFQLALKEAEALAFQTEYPHLLFPSLALEKIQAVSAWQARQQSLRHRGASFAEAA